MLIVELPHMSAVEVSNLIYLLGKVNNFVLNCIQHLQRLKIFEVTLHKKVVKVKK